jgi:sterol desaturase/sphingolipid hydroxylase (fatty acid hydroxylase superfamily)
MEDLTTPASTLAALVAGMAGLSLLEAVLPLHPRGRRGRAHVPTNLALTAITFAVNAALGAALSLALAALEARGLGLLPALALPPLAHAAAALLALDLAFYLSHVAMHAWPSLWRFHRVHHSDAAVDVTTSFRQHPAESAIRYAFSAVVAVALGASPAAFALYRTASALVALLEHANLRVPARLDALLSLAVTWPNVHKVHHARDVRLTDTNFGNLLCWWDRLFGTFTPARVGASVRYGLDGLDAPRMQTARALLALPFRVTAGRTPGIGYRVGAPGYGARGRPRRPEEEPWTVRG